MILFPVIRRRRIISRRKLLCTAADRKEALAYTFAWCAMLLADAGVDAKGGSMLLLAIHVRERFGDEMAVRYSRFAEQNSEALFSTHGITEEQYQAGKAFADDLLPQVKEKLSRKQRFRARWIKCHF